MEELNITYQKSQDLVKEYISEPITKLHLRETEVFMRELAKKFNEGEEDKSSSSPFAIAQEDEEKWGIIGLLHDIDWDLTKTNPLEHCIKAQEILKTAGASDFLIETIISHGYSSEMNPAEQDEMKKRTQFSSPLIPGLCEKQRSTKIQYCLAAAETLTGIIIATALIQPDKKLQSVSLISLKKKFKNKSFAAKCNRDIVLECEKAGILLDEFLQIGLSSLQSISGELGL